MGWLPIVSMKELVYPRVIKCFYYNMTLEDEGPITINVNSVEIKFDVADLCKILDISNEGLCLYESKKWPKVDGFKLIKVVQRLYGYEKASRPTSHSLIVLSRVQQHMI